MRFRIRNRQKKYFGGNVAVEQHLLNDYILERNSKLIVDCKRDFAKKEQHI